MRPRILTSALIAISIIAISQIVHAQETGWKDPQLLSVPKTILPKEAKESGLRGKVSVVVTVDERGAVAGAYEATGPDWTCPQIERPDVVAMRNAAKALALKAKFKPATQDGKAVISTMTIDFQFGTPKPPSASKLTGAMVGRSDSDTVSGPKMTMRPDSLTKLGNADSDTGAIVGQATVADGSASKSEGSTTSAKTVQTATTNGGLSSSAETNRASISTIDRSQTISGGVLNGKAIALPKPKYPPAARAVRASGAVSVQVLIDENGNVFSSEPVSGHPLLRGESVKAACGARFSPTLLEGKPVKVLGIITYNYVP